MNPLVTTHRYRRVMVVRCRGDLDLSSTSELQACLAQVPAPAPPAHDSRHLRAHRPASGSTRAPGAAAGDVDAIVVDLAEVTFMDCSALRTLVALSERCAQQGARFLLSGPTAIVLRLLNALQLDRVFVVTRTLTEAIALAETWTELGELPLTQAADPSGGTHPALPAPATHHGSAPGPLSGGGSTTASRATAGNPVSRQPMSRPSSGHPDDNDLQGRRWMI
jgi:anti-anti-sigma regulatory factor